MLAEALQAIRSRRPDLSLYPRLVVEAVLCVEGPVGSAEEVARFLGLRNRYALRRLFEREGVPSLRRLSSWVLILSWVQSAEREGWSLFRLAFRSHRHPSACYRLVREVTGLRWMEVLGRGSQWVQRQLLLEFGVEPRELPVRAPPPAAK